MLRHVQDQAGLAHRGSGRDDHQIAGVKAGGHLVEIRESARHPGDRPLALLQLLDGREAGLHEIPERHEAFADPPLGNREDRALGFVEEHFRFQFRFVRLGQDLVGRVDQAAERRLLLDDPRVVLDVGRSRYAVGQRRDVGRPPDLVQLPGPRQFFLQRDEVDGMTAFAERHHLVEDAAVRITEEVLGVDQLGGVVERVVVDQDRAEDRLLGIEIVRKRPFRRSNFRHCGGG
jgi:hypothetical protein